MKARLKHQLEKVHASDHREAAADRGAADGRAPATRRYESAEEVAAMDRYANARQGWERYQFDNGKQVEDEDPLGACRPLDPIQLTVPPCDAPGALVSAAPRVGGLARKGFGMGVRFLHAWVGAVAMLGRLYSASGAYANGQDGSGMCSSVAGCRRAASDHAPRTSDEVGVGLTHHARLPPGGVQGWRACPHAQPAGSPPVGHPQLCRKAAPLNTDAHD